jgi:hypothetical protein
MAERSPKLARAATAPIPARPIPAPPTEAHVNNRCRTNRFLGTDLQRMQNMLFELRNRRNGPPITTTNEQDKESSTETGQRVTPISGDGDGSRGTYKILNRFCEPNEQVITRHNPLNRFILDFGSI